MLNPKTRDSAFFGRVGKENLWVFFFVLKKKCLEARLLLVISEMAVE